MAAEATAAPRKGGRPSLSQAGQLEERLLDSAAELFLSHGYGATSIEAIAKQAGISKRSLYHRYAGKAELFAAVVQRLMAQLRPDDEAHLFSGAPLPELLRALAGVLLHAALSPDAIRLHRLLLSEVGRFPELAAIAGVGRQEGVRRIGELLAQHGELDDARFAAEQFMQLVMSVPQRRAMGLGAPMGQRELDEWAARSVELFLRGCFG